MDLMLASRGISFVAIAVLVFAACGGKITDLDAGPTQQPPDSGKPETAPPQPIDAGGRICPPECLVGHQCCVNGCGGIPAAMPSDCCSCLPNETDSTQCPNSKCGG